MLTATRITAILVVLVPFCNPATAIAINKCQAGKNKCVSKNVSCLLGCYAKGAQTGIFDDHCVLRCKRKFDGNLLVPPDDTKGCIQSLQAKGDCLTGDETAAMTASVDAFVGGVVCDLDPSAGTCLNPKHVFLSSTEVAANFGGLAAADTVCQELAGAAGLSGIYRAWLSDGSKSPAARFTHSTGPYVLVGDAVVVANDWADLIDGSLVSAIVSTESGSRLDNVDVWTGTDENGQSTGTSCFGWTSTSSFETGLAGLAKTGELAWWTEYETLPCDGIAHLYCFEQ
jgi:hypothetical protein